MFYQLFENKYFNFDPYKAYSNEKKIDVHLKLHRVLCIQMEAVEKIEKLRLLDAYEREVFRIAQLEIREDIDKCENEISHLSEDITDPVLMKDIKAAGIDGTLHKIIGHEKLHANRAERIKGLLLMNEFNVLQMDALKNRKSDLYINEYENKCKIKIFLEILNDLSNKIVENYSSMYSIYKEIPIDYKYKLELKDAIEDSQIQTSEALKTGKPYSKNTNPKKKSMYKYLIEKRSYITINYLKEEILDLRKLTLEEWSKKRYDYVFSSYSPYDPKYIFNFQALLKDFENYSLKKQVEVYLAVHSSIKVQLKALEKWSKEKKEFTEYEIIIYSYNWRTLFSLLVYYDTQIAGIFLIKIKNENFYDKNLINELGKKISEKIKLDKYHIQDNEPFILHVNSSAAKSILENKEHLKEDIRIYDEIYLELAWSFHPNYINFDQADILPSYKYDPNRAKYFEFILSLRELETAKIEALLENNKTLRISRNEQRFDKIYVQSLCAYRTSKALLTDEKIWHFYSMLPDDYPNRENIYNEIKKANVSLEETKDDTPDRELYDYENYPGSRKLCLRNNEDPKPSESQSEA